MVYNYQVYSKRHFWNLILSTQPDPIKQLILALSRLPGIGEKTAGRLAFFLLNAPEQITQDLATALTGLHSRIFFCKKCANFTSANDTNGLCEYCTDTSRNDDVICVVEDVPALMSVERTGEFKGRYSVLHGVLSPLDGIGPDRLKIGLLLERLRTTQVTEVILATNPSVEGEATALYLQKLIAPMGMKISRIASGIPMGANLQYADQLSLAQALLGRRPF